MAQLHIRDIDEETIRQIKIRARARGWNIGKYVEQLVLLHGAVNVIIQADPPFNLEETVKGLELETKLI